jgi:hypothetical protein
MPSSATVTSAKPVSKRHHFVAEMLSKRFADPHGKLYCFNKNCPEGGVFPGTPKNLFVRGHLHTIQNKDGTKNDLLEKYFSALEYEADQIIEKIVTSVRRGCAPGLTTEEKQIWDRFVYSQWTRVPDMHEKFLSDEIFEPVMQKTYAEFESSHRPVTAEELREFQNPEWRARTKQRARVRMLASPSPKVAEIFARKGLGIGVIKKPNKSFVIGSFPVVKLAFPDRSHLMDPTVEIWLPIAHDVVVSPAPIPPAAERVIFIQDYLVVRHLNEAIFRQSTIVAGRSPKLIASLAGLAG